MTTVSMVMSVGGDYVAGEQYDVDEETADRFVILGYAEGELSRDYSDEEQDAIRATVQGVSV